VNKTGFIICLALLFVVTARSVCGQTDYAELAREASLNGKHEEAVTLYTKAIEAKPYDALYSLRANEYQELGKLDLALADRTKVIELKPFSLEKALEQRGKLYVHMGKYDLAVADYKQALSIRPSRTRILNYLAEAHLIMGRPDLAYLDFNLFLLSEKTDDGFLANAIPVAYLSLRKFGKNELAKKFISEEVPKFELTGYDAQLARFLNGDMTAAQLLADTNGAVGAHFYIGEMLLLDGDTAGAAEHFKFVRDNGTKYTFAYDLAVAELSRIPAPKSVARRNAEVLASNGWGLNSKNDREGAIASFTRAIEIDPNFAHAYTGRGTMYFYLSKYDLALADFDRSLKLDPDDTMTLANRSSTYLAIGEIGRALADANRLVSLDPNKSGYFEYRGQAYLRQGKFDLSIADYAKAASLDPKDPWPVKRRAFAEFAAGQYPAAHKDASAAIAMDLTKDSDGGNGTIVIGYLALARQGKRAAADAFLKDNVTRVFVKQWSSGIINYINGDATEDELFALPDADHAQTRYRTYVAEVLLAKGQAAAAKRHLAWVSKNGFPNCDEYILAKIELARLVSSK